MGYRSARASKRVKEVVVEVNQCVSSAQLIILTTTTFIFRKMVNRKMSAFSSFRNSLSPEVV